MREKSRLVARSALSRVRLHVAKLRARVTCVVRPRRDAASCPRGAARGEPAKVMRSETPVGVGMCGGYVRFYPRAAGTGIVLLHGRFESGRGLNWQQHTRVCVCVCVCMRACVRVPWLSKSPSNTSLGLTSYSLFRLSALWDGGPLRP